LFFHHDASWQRDQLGGLFSVSKRLGQLGGQLHRRLDGFTQVGGPSKVAHGSGEADLTTKVLPHGGEEQEASEETEANRGREGGQDRPL